MPAASESVYTHQRGAHAAHRDLWSSGLKVLSRQYRNRRVSRGLCSRNVCSCAGCAPRTRSQGRDDRARTLRAEYPARDAEPAARSGGGQAGLWLHCVAECGGLEGERRPSRPMSTSRRGWWLSSNARHPSGPPAADRDRHRQILRRLDAGRAHHVQHARGQEAAGDDRLGAGGSQPQGRHRSAGRTTAGRPTRSFTSSAQRSLRRTMSTTTGWARIRRDFSIIAAIRCVAGTTTRLRRRRLPACRFSSPTRATDWCGTTHRRPLSSRASTSRRAGSSEVGDRVSFFVIAGATADEIYAGYRLLTGPTPMLPKAAYGYIQCKQRYASQDEVLAVAKGYRERHLPADVLVVDWFYYTKMGQMDLDPKFWPDPDGDEQAAARHGLRNHDQRVAAVCAGRSLLRRAAQEWLVHSSRPTARRSTACPTTAPVPTSIPPIPTQRSGTGRRFATTSSARDSIRCGPTRPSPTCRRTARTSHIGPGTQYFNVYPLFHTGALYDGFRKDEPGRARADSLARRLPGRAAQRRHRLVVGYLSDVGHAQAADSHRPRFCGFGHHLLVERHGRLAVSARGASSGASAAA